MYVYARPERQLEDDETQCTSQWGEITRTRRGRIALGTRRKANWPSLGIGGYPLRRSRRLTLPSDRGRTFQPAQDNAGVTGGVGSGFTQVPEPSTLAAVAESGNSSGAWQATAWLLPAGRGHPGRSVRTDMGRAVLPHVPRQEGPGISIQRH